MCRYHDCRLLFKIVDAQTICVGSGPPEGDLLDDSIMTHSISCCRVVSAALNHLANVLEKVASIPRALRVESMPNSRTRRRPKAAAFAKSKPYNAPSLDGLSLSSADDYPMTPHMTHSTTGAASDGTFNLPGSSPENSEESSDGWSDSAGLSSEDDEEIPDTLNGSSENLECAMLERNGGDGLTLVSDDELDVDDEAYLSDTALSLNAFKKPSLQANSETSPEDQEQVEESYDVPVCVSLRNLSRSDSDSPSIEDTARNYNSRYDGSLQDLVYGVEEHSGSAGGGAADADVDDDDSDDSSSEMAGYLSSTSGETRGPDLFLKPYVGARPPTPPSPSKSPKQPKIYKAGDALDIQTPRAQYPPPPSIEHDEGAFDPYQPRLDEGAHDIYLQSYVEQVYEQENAEAIRNGSQHEDTVYGVPYGGARDEYSNQEQYPDHHSFSDQYAEPEEYVEDKGYPSCPRAVGGTQSPEMSGATHEDETTTMLVLSLAKARKKDRRLIHILAFGLGCTLVALAAVIGGVVAMTLLKSENTATLAPLPLSAKAVITTVAPVDAPAAVTSPLSPVAAPLPATLQTIAPVVSLQVDASPSLSAPPPTTAVVIAPTTVLATNAPTRAPTTTAPMPQILSTTPLDTSAPTNALGSVKLPPI